MKKIILSLTFILFATIGFSQVLKPVKIDSLVTVSIPSNFVKKDTLGQQIYSANGSLGYIVVIRAPNAPNNKPLNKERDLNHVLKTYIDGIQHQSHTGSVMNPRDTTIGSLKAKVFTLRIDNSGSTGESPQLKYFILLYTQEVTYTFEYNYPEQRSELVKADLKAFSSSIKLAPDLKRNDQYISNAKGLSFGAKVGIYGGLPLVIIIVLIVVNRRKKRLAEEA
ncbi:GGIII-like transmembrane region-containing protein [Mucilaginibacter sp. SP1R1]|uniref:GGIII-like transmembrane region-containing protein n=1 Tax=Mucilaginibacter sp. SP1R1 TaxID=2723091 RepID=UPI0016183C71|nr:GGIII-like transmembrane region-containing protein [Mucilaginibacter sp. SP1R1]MBB6151868.1 hypothetical protein [Mucilaginibacter sp. SP1R1]